MRYSFLFRNSSNFEFFVIEPHFNFNMRRIPMKLLDHFRRNVQTIFVDGMTIILVCSLFLKSDSFYLRTHILTNRGGQILELWGHVRPDSQQSRLGPVKLTEPTCQG